MSHFDDLPQRDRSHDVEEAAIVAFQARLAESGVFVLQSSDRKDYGTDCQIEVIEGGRATNVRIHVQLKGTEGAPNADGSIGVQVRRANLNYLLAQPYSFYVSYHLPTDALRICQVDAVLRQYDHGGSTWTQQQTLTVTFTEDLTVERLHRIATLTRSAAKTSRDRRIDQVRTPPADVPTRLLRATPDIHVPDDPALAAELLTRLFEKDADEVVSAAFDRFAVVLGAESEPMGICYMAEINVGLARRSAFPERLLAAVAYFRARIDGGVHHPANLLYTIGNAFSALGDEEQAKSAYLAALLDPAITEHPELMAQAYKNLGTSLERMGSEEAAAAHYQDSLQLLPDLAEAHHALGHYHARRGAYADALAHFDQVVFVDQNVEKTLSVNGWRANVLFNLGEGRAAFREINSLVGQAGRADWIWPWCARQVASFGRASPDNAVQAAAFWERCIKAFPVHSAARRELLLSTFYLRDSGRDIGKTYEIFCAEFDRLIAGVEDQDAALPWDRLGHWAQDEANWQEAERCFRKAYDLEGGHYGYCLGTALNFLDRFEESRPLLLEQAQALQPDAMSWFQLGVACGNLGRSTEAIDAYGKALDLDSDYALAVFNLGGVYWNDGDRAKALEIWRPAIARFPDHELAARLRQDMPGLF